MKTGYNCFYGNELCTLRGKMVKFGLIENQIYLKKIAYLIFYLVNDESICRPYIYNMARERGQYHFERGLLRHLCILNTVQIPLLIGNYEAFVNECIESKCLK